MNKFNKRIVSIFLLFFMTCFLGGIKLVSRQLVTNKKLALKLSEGN